MEPRILQPVTVVITVLNDKINLEKCLESLLDQDYPKEFYKIIIVDAGSTDGTIDVIRECQVKQKDIQIELIQRKRCNRSQGRNSGLKRSKTEFVAVVNSDAIVAENWLTVVVRELRKLESVFDEFKPDCVVHLVALASVPDCERHFSTAYETNVIGTLNVVRCAVKHHSKIVYSSSSAVYGNPKQLPTPESYPRVPVNRYGMTKIVGERIISRHANGGYVIFRIFNSYGPKCYRSYVTSDIIKKIKSRRNPVRLLGTGEEARDFIYIDDVVDAFIIAINNDGSGVFNLGTGKATSIKMLASKIAEIVGRNDIQFVFDGERRLGDFKINQADISRMKRELGFYPKISLEEGLMKTVGRI